MHSGPKEETLLQTLHLLELGCMASLLACGFFVEGEVKDISEVFA